jgi:hypothetical protein
LTTIQTLKERLYKAVGTQRTKLIIRRKIPGVLGIIHISIKDAYTGTPLIRSAVVLLVPWNYSNAPEIGLPICFCVQVSVQRRSETPEAVTIQSGRAVCIGLSV